MAKLGMLIGFGAGYVIGARAGRQRYDQMVAKAQDVWSDPRVQKRTSQAQDAVQDKATQAAGAVQDAAKDKIPGLGRDQGSADTGDGDVAPGEGVASR